MITDKEGVNVCTYILLVYRLLESPHYLLTSILIIYISIHILDILNDGFLYNNKPFSPTVSININTEYLLFSGERKNISMHIFILRFKVK